MFYSQCKTWSAYIDAQVHSNFKRDKIQPENFQIATNFAQVIIFWIIHRPFCSLSSALVSCLKITFGIVLNSSKLCFRFPHSFKKNEKLPTDSYQTIPSPLLNPSILLYILVCSVYRNVQTERHSCLNEKHVFV